MKPAPFEYVRAESIEHALEVKAAAGADARFLAGGQSLIPAMNFRLASPAMLIDLDGLVELDQVGSAVDGALRLGAMVRHRRLGADAAIRDRQPLLHETVPNVAHPQVRNRGTLGGNLSHADPASEYPAVMRALGARMRLRSVRGERWVDADAFFQNLYTTALQDDEMLVEVALPAMAARTGTAFLEVSRRQGDFAMMGVAAVVGFDDAGRCTMARLAFCSAGPTPMLAPAAARSLVGERLADTTGAAAIDAAAAMVRDEIAPGGSIHASVAYQQHLAQALTRRALHRAAARATGGAEPVAAPRGAFA